jgi:hypothetical protein
MKQLKHLHIGCLLFFDWKTFIIHMLLYKPSIPIFYDIHDQDINCHHNLQVSHILCILEKKIQSSNDI